MLGGKRTIGLLFMVTALAIGTAAMAAQVKLHTINGEVSKVDASLKSVTVKGTVGKREKEMSMQLAPDASITRNKEKIGLDALKVGDRVIVRFASAKGMMTAHSISLQEPGAKPKTSDVYKK
jgi:Cu/Ag efflux protein CusF